MRHLYIIFMIGRWNRDIWEINLPKTLDWAMDNRIKNQIIDEKAYGRQRFIQYIGVACYFWFISDKIRHIKNQNGTELYAFALFLGEKQLKSPILVWLYDCKLDLSPRLIKTILINHGLDLIFCECCAKGKKQL